MLKQVLVANALKDLVAGALPRWTVIGLDAGDAKPERIVGDGLAIIRPGNPGDADIDLSPPTYWYDHRFPIELTMYQQLGATGLEDLGTAMTAIGAAIAADRYLGGLCTWLDADAPALSFEDRAGAQPICWADLGLVASYSTNGPLG